MAEMSEKEMTFLDTIVYKGDRFLKRIILYFMCEHISNLFQDTNLYSSHPPGVTEGFIKGEVLRLLRTNSSQCIYTFEET